MIDKDSIAEFRRNPIGYLDRVFPAAGDTFWLPGRQLCVAEPAMARAILINADGLYEEQSDFFRTRRGVFGPRQAQIQIGRSARTLLRSHLQSRAEQLEHAVRSLPASSAWPDAGNRLVYRHLLDALISPDSPASLRRMIDEVARAAPIHAGPTSATALTGRTHPMATGTSGPVHRL